MKGVIYQMKKNLTKLLALMMALALVFSLAACGGDDAGDTTTPPANVDANGDETLDPANPANPADPSDTTPTDESNTDESGEQPSDNDATTPDGKKDTTPTSGGKNTDPAKPDADTGLNTSDKAQVVDAYKKAASAAGKIKRLQTMKLVDLNIGDKDMNKFPWSTLKGIVDNLISKNSGISDVGMPGNFGALTQNDLTSAKASTSNGVTTLEMTLKNQTDYKSGHPGTKQADAWGAGPVGHGIGVLGSIQPVLDDAKVVTISNEKDIEVTYTNATIKVTVKNGKVVSGSMGYTVKINLIKGKALGVGLDGTAGTLRYDYKIG